MLKENKQNFIGIAILIFSLLIMAGCSSKPAAEKIHTNTLDQNSSINTHAAKALTQTEVAEQFITANGFKIIIDSGNGADIKLPETFEVKSNGIPIGNLLKQRNEQSKQKELDFSSYLGKNVTLYTYGVESKQVVNEKVDIVMDKTKVVGFWTDTHKEPPDFNVIIGALNSN